MDHVIYPFPICRLQGDKGMFTYRMFYGTKYSFPIFGWLIEIGREKIMIDCPGPATEMEKYSTAGLKGEDIRSMDECLKERGISAEDITTVILTHLHYDHITGAEKFPNARFVVQEKELEFALTPHPLFKKSYRRNLIEKMKFDPVSGDVLLFPGVELIFTPGHTPGAQSVAVDTAKGKVVIAGFCSIKENFSPPEPANKTWAVIPPGIMVNSMDAYDSALRIKEIADIVIPLHERETVDMETIP